MSTLQAAIAGIGQTEFSKDSGRSELQLAVEAVHAAILDAGLTPADVDGLVTFGQDANDEITIARAIGIPELRWTARTGIPGGAGASATVQLAAAAASWMVAEAPAPPGMPVREVHRSSGMPMARAMVISSLAS